MKKLISICAFLMLVTSTHAIVSDFTVNGIKYHILTATTVEVTSNSPIYSGSITIPASVVNLTKTYDVTAIGAGSFRDCTGLSAISMANSITSIKASAFSGCSNLSSVSIPNSVTSIANYSFEKCISITSITLPNALTSIGYNAFDGCTGLKTITCLNSTPTTLGADCFLNVTNVTDVYVPNYAAVTAYKANTEWITAFTGAKIKCAFIVGGIRYNATSANTVEVISNSVKYSGSITISATVIYNGVTYNVTSIGNSAFYNCSGLTAITFPSSVTSIGSEAFNGCTSLTSIFIPNTITSIGGYAFQSCISLTSLVIPSSITSISVGAFYYCSGLTTVSIPSSVTSIGINAFSNCTSLTSLTCLGNTPPTLGTDCFKNVTKVTDVFVPSDDAVTAFKANSAWIGFFPDTIIKKMIPPTFTVGGITYNTTSANTVEVTSNSPAYTGSITVPSSVDYLGVTYSVTAIGSYAFQGCDITSVSIPNTVTSIGNYAFYYTDYNFKSITIPSSVTSIGNYAFNMCRGLRSVICLSIIPAILGSNCFSIEMAATVSDVYVPSDPAVAAYKGDTNWLGFFPGTIIKKNSITGLATLGNNKVKIYTTASEILIDGLGNATTVELYNLNGMRLQTLRSQGNESVSISSLPQGLYIVKLITSEYTIERKVLKK